MKDQSELNPGQSIGSYHVISLIGRGGMGEVYLAEDVRLGRKVALKILPASVAGEVDRLRRFEQEARTASALNHPNILTIHEIGEVEGRRFIATEYIDGETLKLRMVTNPMSLNEALEITEQVASALVVAHAKGIIHRDIKPDNIMVRRDGIVKVLDFGLTKLLREKASESDDQTRALIKTNTGVVMGTVTYMSPEQARGLRVDARTDIWSLGVVLYEMLAGHVPFTGPTNSDIIVSILEREPPPLSSSSPEVPAELQRIVTKALRKDCGLRYQQLQDFLVDLKSLKQTLASTPTLPAVERQSAAQISDQTRNSPAVLSAAALETPSPTSSAEYIVKGIKNHKRGVMLALAAVVIAAIVFGYFYFFRTREAVDRAAAQPPIKSLAVLPFKNLSGDLGDDYFNDGLTESLITSLSKIANLKVMSRGSVFHFKNSQLSPQEIGKQLGVEVVLEGSVRKRGESVRVDVRLVSVADGHVLWANDAYDHALGDLFALQDEIARKVATGLRLRLDSESERRLARRYTDSPEAYQLYLQGRFYWNNFTSEKDLERAIQYFEAAIVKDPKYALAYSGLADSYIILATNWRNPNEVLPRAREYARKAVEFDNTLGEAHYSLGSIAFLYDWDWERALEELRLSLDLDAKSLEGNACYLHGLETLQTGGDAFRDVRRALDQNPLSAPISSELGCASYYTRHYDQTIDFSQQTLALDQSYPFAHYNKARALGQQRKHEQAIADLNTAARSLGRSTMVLAELGYNYGALGKKAEAQKLLDELKARSAREFIDPYPVAFIYVALGRNNEALRSLEQAYEVRSTWMPWINVEPKFDSLHSDPRFNSLLKRLNLARVQG